MADEATDALIPEAPSTEAAAPSDEAPASDPYQPRYENLRTEFNRKQAIWDRAQQGDIEAMRELNLPLQFEEPEDATPDMEYDDPYAAKLADLEQKQAKFEQWQQQQEAAALAEVVGKDIDRLAKENELSLSDDDKEYIVSRAAKKGINKDSVRAAFDAHANYLNTMLDAKREEWIETKKSPRVGTGQAASKQPDLTNPEERRAWAIAKLQGDA